MHIHDKYFNNTQVNEKVSKIALKRLAYGYFLELFSFNLSLKHNTNFYRSLNANMSLY